jgi:cytochrome c peroxidase
MKATQILVIAATLTGSACKKQEAAKQQDPGPPGSATEPPPPQRPSQGSLARMPELELPDDPKRKEKIALGHALFFDKRLSGDGTTALLLVPHERGRQRRQGSARDRIGRQAAHAPLAGDLERRLLDQNAFYWDGRAKTLEANVAKGAWGGGNMGAGADKLDKKAAEIAKIAGYKPLFEAAFGDRGRDQGRRTSPMRSRSTCARSICNDTAYDKFAAGDKSRAHRAAAAGPRRLPRQGQVHRVPHAAVLLDGDGCRRRRYFNAASARRSCRGQGRRRPHEGHERCRPTGRRSSRRACAT